MKAGTRKMSLTGKGVATYIILQPVDKDCRKVAKLRKALLELSKKEEHPPQDAKRAKSLSLALYQLSNVRCQDFYLLRTHRPLEEDERKQLHTLNQIAHNGESDIKPLEDFVKGSMDTMSFFILPRAGTRSPWSSKAQAILKELFPPVETRIEKGWRWTVNLDAEWEDVLGTFARDRMTESVFTAQELLHFFDAPSLPTATRSIAMTERTTLKRMNAEWGLALSEQELDYLMDVYRELGRPATDAELMAFSQLNSEHCRHKVFNSALSFNRTKMPATLFAMIKSTSAAAAAGLISAYEDNAAIFATRTAQGFHPLAEACGLYHERQETNHLVFKAETHNHPTFVSPHPGAATGIGGEIRDELACGRGARTKAGFVGFSVADLSLPWSLPNETKAGEAPNKARGMDIMLEAPLGGSTYGNEFGRPCLGGYFRTLNCVKEGVYFGHHKPIMLAGGWGEIASAQVKKEIDVSQGPVHLIVLGEPALRIGLGGSSVSSMKSSDDNEELDFASVQRDNAEMERRCAEVIYQCTQYGDENPIQFIHDVGAGGVGNALTELLKDNDCGGEVHLEKIPIADESMSPLEIWNNESQERFVLAVGEKNLQLFDKLARREDAPYAVVGRVKSKQLKVMREEGEDKKQTSIIDLPLHSLFPEEELHLSAEIPAQHAPAYQALRQQRYQLSAEIQHKKKDGASSAPPFTRETAQPAARKSDPDEAAPQASSASSYVKPQPRRAESEYANSLISGAPTDTDKKAESITATAIDILRLPAVASKSFLITINDRSVGGLTAREQLIGPWQQPVSDYAATLQDYHSHAGEVCALGERTPVAVLNPPAAARLALAEVITNLAAAGIKDLKDIRLCANWMAAVEDKGQLYALYESVRTVTQELCPQLQLAIPVGKDSLFMRAEWTEPTEEATLGDETTAEEREKAMAEEGATTKEGKEAKKGTGAEKRKEKLVRVISPISLVMSGLAPVADVRLGVTPQLSKKGILYLVSLQSKGEARQLRMGGSAYTQLRDHWEGETPDLDEASRLRIFFEFISGLTQRRIITAYHDISDGGLWGTLCEMAFATNCGLNIEMSGLAKQRKEIHQQLFNEELGAVIQVSPAMEEAFQQEAAKFEMMIHSLGAPNAEDLIHLTWWDELVLEEKMTRLRLHWHSVSDNIRILRDEDSCVQQEQDLQQNYAYPGLREDFDYAQLQEKTKSIAILNKEKPRVAILRTHGINGQREMAAAFSQAGFSAYDVHINDLLNGDKMSWADYKGAVFCGGFSYGDALGAGSGWAASILLNMRLREQFEQFFARPDTFTLGVCNGCQALAKMEEIIPDADWHCEFKPNQSQRFESRTVMMKVAKSKSIFLQGMEGSLLPIAAAHGEGRAVFHSSAQVDTLNKKQQAALFYANSQGRITQQYPLNPNGSARAIAGITSADGRVTLMMPHPERVFRRAAQTWRNPAAEWNEQDTSPWHTIFLNARLWVE